MIVLTPKGQTSVARLQSEVTEFAMLLFGTLPEGDLKTFRGILDDVGAKLTELAKDSSGR